MPEDLKYIINQSQLTDIGAAIRSKLGEQDTYTVDEMPEKIGEIGGGSSNEEYIILLSGEYDVDPQNPLPLIAGLPCDANYITVKIAGVDYVFEYTDNLVEIAPGFYLGGYYNSNFSDIAFKPDQGISMTFVRLSEETPQTMVIDEIRAKPNDSHYYILTATIINERENPIYVNEVFTLPEEILCLENGNIVDKSEETIPAESSLVLNIIVGSDFSQTGTRGGRQTFTVTGNPDDLNNCTVDANGVISVIPDYFPINSTASVTITAVIPK